MTTASTPPSPASWPPAPAAAPTPPGRRLDLPIIGAEYPQLLRTPRSRWWHPLLSAGFVLGSVLVLLAVLTLPMMLALVSEVGWDVFASADPADLARVEEALFSAPMMLLNNLMLAAFIGVALLAVAVCHPVAARFVHSVQGRIRWRWLLRAHLVLLPLSLALAGPAADFVGARSVLLAGAAWTAVSTLVAVAYSVGSGSIPRRPAISSG